MTLKNISIFHSLGFPILLGISRKRFIRELSEENDIKKELEELCLQVFLL